MAWTVSTLAERLGLRFEGDGARAIRRVASLQSAGPDALTFVSRAAFIEALGRTGAGAVIVAPEHADRAPCAVLVSSNPYAAYARAAQLLHPEASAPGIDPGASVDGAARIGADVRIGARAVVQADARIGDGAVIGPGAFVGRGARVGAGSYLGPNVIIAHECELGARCRVQPGAVIGSDGFGYARDGNEWVRIPQIGRVVIGDDVDIGANTTIDRGALDDTVIEDGVKLDNLIQIAHNVRIGAHTAMAGCTGVAGSAVIGRRCTIGGAASILGHLEIVDDVHLSPLSFVTKSITLPGSYSSGMPIEPTTDWRRSVARLRQLDALARRVTHLEREKSDKRS